MIRILTVEDSDVVAMLLKSILEQSGYFDIIGHARDGREAVQMCHELNPDLVTMDIRMPVMDGFEATRMIMTQNPVPIVVVSSSVDNEELQITFRAIEEGALSVIEKPCGFGHPDFQAIQRELVDTLRAMAEVKLVRRIQPQRNNDVDIFESTMLQQTGNYQLIALGCSTGGPQALLQIVSSLPVGLPVPVVVVQHISKGFIGGMVKWLNGNTLLNIKIASENEELEAGTIYFAPDDNHLCVKNEGGLRASLNKNPAVSGFRPSATMLFNSVAQVLPGRAIAGLLTGMGNDGAQGLLEARNMDCHTFVQDEKSAIIYGMPRTALALNAVDKVIELENMASYLTGLVQQ